VFFTFKNGFIQFCNYNILLFRLWWTIVFSRPPDLNGFPIDIWTRQSFCEFVNASVRPRCRWSAKHMVLSNRTCYYFRVVSCVQLYVNGYRPSDIRAKIRREVIDNYKCSRLTRVALEFLKYYCYMLLLLFYITYNIFDRIIYLFLIISTFSIQLHTSSGTRVQ